MTTSKKIIFSVITLCLFFLALLGFEYLVRWLSPGSVHRLVTEERYDQIDWYKVNRGYLSIYFSSDDPLIPEFKPSLFRKVKTDSTFRILCIGESSMFGVPYQMTANIPGIIRRQLRNQYPMKEIEVINLGASAINSNVIRHFAPDLLAVAPDLVLIYTGHNEFYGPDGVGASWLEKRLPFLIEWKYDLRESALLNLVGSLFGGTESAVGKTDANLMRQVSKDTQVPLESPETEWVLSRFSENLSAIVSTFTDRRIPVVISDITSDLMFPPFEYDRSSDSNNARRSYLLGLEEIAAGRYEDAKYSLERARDLDLLKFRAPAGINAVIRATAARHHLPFFSADSIVSAASPHGITDTTLFWEHLHPKAKGYYLIANGFVRMIDKERYLGTSPVTDALLPFDADSLHICWLDLAFADLTISNMTSKWPFTDYTVTTNDYPTAGAELRSIVDGVLSNSKVWDQGCYETAQVFWRQGDLRRAMTTYRAVIDEYPYNFYAHYLLGSAQNQSGRVAEAVEHYSVSIRSNPSYPFPAVDLGLIDINLGRVDEAVALLENALTIARHDGMTPLQSTIYYGLGTAYANKGDFSRALSYADQALALVPTNADARELKRKLQLVMGK